MEEGVGKMRPGSRASTLNSVRSGEGILSSLGGSGKISGMRGAEGRLGVGEGRFKSQRTTGKQGVRRTSNKPRSSPLALEPR